jgi:hypothetical protein
VISLTFLVIGKQSKRMKYKSAAFLVISKILENLKKNENSG